MSETNNESFKAEMIAEIKKIQAELDELKNIKKDMVRKVVKRKPAKKTAAKKKGAKRKPAKKTAAKKKGAKRKPAKKTSKRKVSGRR